MPRRTNPRTADAMQLVLDKTMTPYAAAKHLKIDISSLYKSRLYRMYKVGALHELAEAMAEIRARG